MKNHVGRPTNEEVKERRRKKIISIFVPVLILVFILAAIISRFDLLKIGGNVSSSSNGECYIYKMSSTKASKVLNYTIECDGKAKISDTQYKVGNGKFQSRGSGFGSYTKKTGKINFKQQYIGKKIQLRVYYNGNKKYDTQTIKLGSGETYKKEYNVVFEDVDDNGNEIKAKCEICKIISAKNSTKLSYKITCENGAKISDTQYKVGNGKFQSRGSGFGSYTKKTGTINFKKQYIGKKIQLRVYYNGNVHYTTDSVVLGSGGGHYCVEMEDVDE